MGHLSTDTIEGERPILPKASFTRLYNVQLDAEGNFEDGEDREIDDKADELITIEKTEANKNKFAVLRDIFDHTDMRVLQN